MVLTTVPQSAMTVLAEEPTQGSDEQAEENDKPVTNSDAVDSDEIDEVEQIASEDTESEGEDEEDEESEEITSEDSDTEKEEQITKEGEATEKPEEADTPKDNVTTEPQGKASDENATKSFNAAETDFDAAESINSVSISFRGKESGSGADEFLDIETVAEIDAVNGFDGSSTTNGNVVFMVKPKAGWETPTVTWHYMKENGEDSSESADILSDSVSLL